MVDGIPSPHRKRYPSKKIKPAAGGGAASGSGGCAVLPLPLLDHPVLQMLATMLLAGLIVHLLLSVAVRRRPHKTTG